MQNPLAKRVLCLLFIAREELFLQSWFDFVL